MSKEIEKRGLGWFKTNRATSDEKTLSNKEAAATNLVEAENTNVDDSSELEPTTNNTLSKDNQDKLSLDLIVSVENLIKDRKLMQIRLNDVTNRLAEVNDANSRYRQDLENREQLLQEKSKEIQTLESNLTNKQMSYDQLLEDYKEYQQNSNTEYELISNQLVTEQDKYAKLNEEFTNNRYEHIRKVNELEEKIRNLEIENNKYATSYQQILGEKNELMQTINEFTERMSFSFTPKSNTSNTTDEE